MLYSSDTSASLILIFSHFISFQKMKNYWGSNAVTPFWCLPLKKKLFYYLIPVLLSRQVRSENKQKNAVMSFTVTDEPIYIDLTLSENKEEVNGSIFEDLFSDFTNIFKNGVLMI